MASPMLFDSGVFFSGSPKNGIRQSTDDAMVSHGVINEQNKLSEGVQNSYEIGLHKQTEKSLRQTSPQLIENHSSLIIPS